MASLKIYRVRLKRYLYDIDSAGGRHKVERQIALLREAIGPLGYPLIDYLEDFSIPSILFATRRHGMSGQCTRISAYHFAKF